jgi:hypothetical protein
VPGPDEGCFAEARVIAAGSRLCKFALHGLVFSTICAWRAALRAKLDWRSLSIAIGIGFGIFRPAGGPLRMRDATGSPMTTQFFRSPAINFYIGGAGAKPRRLFARIFARLLYARP